MRALVCHPRGSDNHFSIDKVILPALKSDEVLVRIIAVAQNPTDVKSFDQNRYGDGAVLGCDFCGIIDKVGHDVVELHIGDRVAGLVRGGSVSSGAYATHTITYARFCFRVPEELSSPAAATIPIGLTTAWLALFSPFSLGIQRETASPQLLIWSGNTSVGQFAIQIAKHYGIEFATTCSSKEVAEKLGAKHIFDYRSPTVIEDIIAVLPNITHVLDCVGTETSSLVASQAITDRGGVLCTVQPGKRYTDGLKTGVRATDVLVFTSFSDVVKVGGATIQVRESLIFYVVTNLLAIIAPTERC